MTLDVDGLRGFIETSLGDDELGLMLEAAYEAIDAYAGSSSSVTELLTPGGDRLMLSCPAESIQSVSETVWGTQAALATDDYELIGDQLVLRLRTGTNPRPRWCGRVRVDYTRTIDEASRDRVAVALVKLDDSFSPGLQSQRLGDWAETYETGGLSGQNDHAQQRAAILATLYASAFVAK